MTQRYNTRVLLSGYPTYVGLSPFTNMHRNNVGKKIASTSWVFDDGTGSPEGTIEISDQEVVIHPDGKFAVKSTNGSAHIVSVMATETGSYAMGGDGEDTTYQLNREKLIKRIPEVQAELDRNYDNYNDPSLEVPDLLRYVIWLTEV